VTVSKSQIDRLGERLKKGAVSDEDLCLLDAYRGSFAEAYEEVVAAIRVVTRLEPTSRPEKSTTSIIEKLHRESIRLSQMQDIAGCRLIVQHAPAQNRVVDRLKTSLARAVVVDRRKEPTHGYRAVHVIAIVRNKPIEIQIRTELEHLWAQLSEKLSDALDPSIKYGGGDPAVRKWLSNTSRLIGELESLEVAPTSEKIDEELTAMRQAMRRILEARIATDPNAARWE